MHKIVLNFGLLVFCMAVIYFAQKGASIDQIIVRSALVFVIVSIAASILVLVFIRAVNKALEKKSEEFEDEFSEEEDELWDLDTDQLGDLENEDKS